MIKVGLSPAPGHQLALIDRGTLSLTGIDAWVRARQELVLVWGWPLAWRIGGPRGAAVFHYPSGIEVPLPDGWILLTRGPALDPAIDLALESRRDPEVEFARFHRRPTWQRAWWYMSDGPEGLFVRRVAAAWSCSVEDILAPVAARNWSDTAELEVPGVGAVEAHVIRLRRPVTER